jgi:hypothetical protein
MSVISPRNSFGWSPCPEQVDGTLTDDHRAVRRNGRTKDRRDGAVFVAVFEQAFVCLVAALWLARTAGSGSGGPGLVDLPALHGSRRSYLRIAQISLYQHVCSHKSATLC